MYSFKKILAVSLAVTGLNVAQGANVAITTLAAAPGGTPPAKKVVTSTTANVPQNSIVRVGFFNLPLNDTTILSVGLFAALEAIFQPIGENPGSPDDGTTGPVRVNAAGGVLGTIQNVDNAYMPAGRELYAWVFAQPTADATATQWAIFRDPTWLMPNGGSLATINLQTWQIDSPTEVYRGTLDAANNRIIMADIVPEPTSALLGMIGLGLTLRRRRA